MLERLRKLEASEVILDTKTDEYFTFKVRIFGKLSDDLLTLTKEGKLFFRDQEVRADYETSKVIFKSIKFLLRDTYTAKKYQTLFRNFKNRYPEIEL